MCETLNKLLSPSRALEPFTASRMELERQAVLSSMPQYYDAVTSSVAAKLSSSMEGGSTLEVLAPNVGNGNLIAEIVSKLLSSSPSGHVSLTMTESSVELAPLAAANVAKVVAASPGSSKIGVSLVAGTDALDKEKKFDFVLNLAGCADRATVAQSTQTLLGLATEKGQVLHVQLGSDALQHRCARRFGETLFKTPLPVLAAEDVISTLVSSLDETTAVRSKILQAEINVTDLLLQGLSTAANRQLINWLLHVDATQLDEQNLALAFHFVGKSSWYKDGRSTCRDPVHLISVTKL